MKHRRYIVCSPSRWPDDTSMVLKQSFLLPLPIDFSILIGNMGRLTSATASSVFVANGDCFANESCSTSRT
ncbi:hypothetical protein LIER_06932 [Lithospermum erythrorhizon]|uniref:Uncharacterized protein n=1 Tax=Lithospermum erythrorhizon TaxID=34254 RepID=A0AAV3P739_LITER